MDLMFWALVIIAIAMFLSVSFSIYLEWCERRDYLKANKKGDK